METFYTSAKSTKSKMMNSLRKGSDASSGFFSESFSSQNGLKTPPGNDFKTRKWKLMLSSATVLFAVNLWTFSSRRLQICICDIIYYQLQINVG